MRRRLSSRLRFSVFWEAGRDKVLELCENKAHHFAPSRLIRGMNPPEWMEIGGKVTLRLQKQVDEGGG